MLKTTHKKLTPILQSVLEGQQNRLGSCPCTNDLSQSNPSYGALSNRSQICWHIQWHQQSSTGLPEGHRHPVNPTMCSCCKKIVLTQHFSSSSGLPAKGNLWMLVMKATVCFSRSSGQDDWYTRTSGNIAEHICSTVEGISDNMAQGSKISVPAHYSSPHQYLFLQFHLEVHCGLWIPLYIPIMMLPIKKMLQLGEHKKQEEQLAVRASYKFRLRQNQWKYKYFLL